MKTLTPLKSLSRLTALSLVLLATFTFSALAAEKTEALSWHDDLEKAQAQAQKEQKPILALFTGSDWCPYCVDLEKNVLSKETFSSFAKDSVVLYKADFRRTNPPPREVLERQNAKAKKYGVRGVPTLFVLDGEGAKLKTFNYGGEEAKAFVAKLKAALPEKPEKSADENEPKVD